MAGRHELDWTDYVTFKIKKKLHQGAEKFDVDILQAAWNNISKCKELSQRNQRTINKSESLNVWRPNA